MQTVLQLSSVLNLTTSHPKHLSSATMVNIVDLHDFLPLFVNWKIIYQLLSCNFPVFYPTKVSRKKISIKPFIQRLQPCEPLEFRIDSTIMVYYEPLPPYTMSQTKGKLRLKIQQCTWKRILRALSLPFVKKEINTSVSFL